MVSPNHRPPLTEPTPVASNVCTDVEIDVVGELVWLTGWQDLRQGGHEHRIVERMVLTTETFRRLLVNGRRLLAKGGH